MLNCYLDILTQLQPQQEVVDGESGQEEAKFQRRFVSRLRLGPGVEAGEADERVGERQRLQSPPGSLRGLIIFFKIFENLKIFHT